MPGEIISKEPVRLEDIDEDIFIDLMHLLNGRSLNLNKPLDRMGAVGFMRELGLLRGVKVLRRTRCVHALARASIGEINGISISCTDVPAGGVQRLHTNLWHRDGGRGYVLANNKLPAQFAVGRIPEGHPIVTTPDLLYDDQISPLVDQAIEDGYLKLFDTDPLAAYMFTGQDFHRARPNPGSVDLERCSIRITTDYLL